MTQGPTPSCVFCYVYLHCIVSGSQYRCAYTSSCIELQIAKLQQYCRMEVELDCHAELEIVFLLALHHRQRRKKRSALVYVIVSRHQKQGILYCISCKKCIWQTLLDVFEDVERFPLSAGIGIGDRIFPGLVLCCVTDTIIAHRDLKSLQQKDWLSLCVTLLQVYSLLNHRFTFLM